jgi:hypothetical protein
MSKRNCIKVSRPAAASLDCAAAVEAVILFWLIAKSRRTYRRGPADCNAQCSRTPRWMQQPTAGAHHA